jgi:hypothetical protein
VNIGVSSWDDSVAVMFAEVPMEATTSERRDFIPYPTNRVVGTVAVAKDARAAINALLAAGFDREDNDILHGEADVHRFDPTGRNTGFSRSFSAPRFEPPARLRSTSMSATMSKLSVQGDS